MNDTWNPWHGCRKISDGCKNCYVYRRDAQYDIDSTAVVKNKTFYAPAERYKSVIIKWFRTAISFIPVSPPTSFLTRRINGVRSAGR